MLFVEQDYAVFENEVQSRSELYNKLHRLVSSHSTISITIESWREIEKLWKQLHAEVRPIAYNLLLIVYNKVKQVFIILIEKQLFLTHVVICWSCLFLLLRIICFWWSFSAWQESDFFTTQIYHNILWAKTAYRSVYQKLVLIILFFTNTRLRS